MADTREDIVGAADHMIRWMGAESRPAEEIQSYVGWGLRDLVGKCLGTQDRGVIDKASKVFREFYLEHLLDRTCLYPGVLEVLDFFGARRQVVVTNKPAGPTETILIGLGIRHYFSDVFAGDSGYPRKPDPEAVLRLIQSERVSTEEALLIGDSLIDIQTARAAGIEMAALAHGFGAEEELRKEHPDRVFSGFEEFLGFVREAGW